MRFIFIAIVFVLLANAEELKCLTNKQIANKEYAVRIKKEYKADDILKRVRESKNTLDIIDIHYVETISWGNEVEIFYFEENINNLVVLKHKNERMSVDEWFLNEKDYWNFRINGIEAFKKSYVPRHSLLIVRNQTPGSASIGGVVEFMLENGIKIEHIIQEDAVGSDYFYDAQGRLYVECEAIEN